MKDSKAKKHEEIEQHEEVIEEAEVDAKADTEVSELEEKVTELENNYKRALADYRNLEARMSDQRSEWIKQANKDLLLRLLPILDTLMLAHQHTKDQTLQVTVQQFLDVLKSEGVTKIDTVEKDFDPYQMEAVTVGEGEENEVIAELRPGFLLHDKVLRPAQVTVGGGK